jgi:hypothetical protein
MIRAEFDVSAELRKKAAKRVLTTLRFSDALVEKTSASEIRPFTVGELKPILSLTDTQIRNPDAAILQDLTRWTLLLGGAGNASLLGPLVRAPGTYTKEEDASLAAFLTLLLMIKALEFAYQCSKLGKYTVVRTDESESMRDVEKRRVMHAYIAAPFSVKPNESKLYDLLIDRAKQWNLQGKRKWEEIEDSLSWDKGSDDAVQKHLPAAVYSGVDVSERHRLAHEGGSGRSRRLIEFIPDVTPMEMQFLISIPHMVLLVDDVFRMHDPTDFFQTFRDPNYEDYDYADGNRTPAASKEHKFVAFYSLPLKKHADHKSFIKSVALALRDFGEWDVGKCEEQCTVQIARGRLLWEERPFLETFRKKVRVLLESRRALRESRNSESRKSKVRVPKSRSETRDLGFYGLMLDYKKKYEKEQDQSSCVIL